MTFRRTGTIATLTAALAFGSCAKPKPAISPVAFDPGTPKIYDCTDPHDKKSYRLDSGGLWNDFENGTVEFEDMRKQGHKIMTIPRFLDLQCTEP